MTVRQEPSTFASDFLEIARSVGRVAASQADTSEARGELAPDVVAALRQSGLFSMMAPRDMGGGGADLLTTVAVNEELARADGSTGWCFMASSTASTFAATYLGDEAVKTMFGNGRLPIAAGVGRPTGKATPVEGGFRGEGLYSFGSGTTYSDWVIGSMLVVDEAGEPVVNADGQPVIRICFVPREKVEFQGNWAVAGLRGTGSVDYRITSQFIPEDFTIDAMAAVQKRGGPIYSLGMIFFALSGHTSVALGLTKRALEEVARIVTAKRRWTANQDIADSMLFRNEFAANEADYRSARAYFMEVVRDAQETAVAGGPVSEEQHARLRQANSWAHAMGLRVVGFCYKWAGSNAFREPSALARVMEDMRVASQHITNDPGVFAEVAPTLLKSWIRPAGG